MHRRTERSDLGVPIADRQGPRLHISSVLERVPVAAVAAEKGPTPVHMHLELTSVASKSDVNELLKNVAFSYIYNMTNVCS